MTTHIKFYACERNQSSSKKVKYYLDIHKTSPIEWSIDLYKNGQKIRGSIIPATLVNADFERTISILSKHAQPHATLDNFWKEYLDPMMVQIKLTDWSVLKDMLDNYDHEIEIIRTGGMTKLYQHHCQPSSKLSTYTNEPKPVVLAH